MFVLTLSLRKPMLTSWHFGAGEGILGQKHAFLTEKMRQTGITLQNSRNPPMGRNFAWPYQLWAISLSLKPFGNARYRQNVLEKVFRNEVLNKQCSPN